MVKVNGEEINISDIPLKKYLEDNGYNLKGIAVECNEAIVPKSRFETFILHSGDVVEIVSFVGGG